MTEKHWYGHGGKYLGSGDYPPHDADYCGPPPDEVLQSEQPDTLETPKDVPTRCSNGHTEHPRGDCLPNLPNALEFMNGSSIQIPSNQAQDIQGNCPICLREHGSQINPEACRRVALARKSQIFTWYKACPGATKYAWVENEEITLWAIGPTIHPHYWDPKQSKWIQISKTLDSPSILSTAELLREQLDMPALPRDYCDTPEEAIRQALNR